MPLDQAVVQLAEVGTLPLVLLDDAELVPLYGNRALEGLIGLAPGHLVSHCSMIVRIRCLIAAWCSGISRSQTRLRPSGMSRPSISWLGVTPEWHFEALA